MILRTIHVGITGRGEGFLEAVGGNEQFRPVAIVEANATAAKVAQYRLLSVRKEQTPIFSGLTGALSQIEADALVISTPTRTHLEFCRMAFTVNQHVLVASPMAAGLADAQQLQAEAEAAWSTFMVAQPMRYTPAQQTIAYILKKPDHPHHPGEVKLVDLIVHRNRPASEGEYPFYFIWEHVIDYADVLLSWLGKLKRVTARSYATPWTKHIQEANLWATLEYDSGTVVNCYLSDDAFAPLDRIVLQGERGWLVLTDGTDLKFHPRPMDAAPAGEGESVEMLDCPAAEQQILSEFFRYVVEEVEPPTSARRNLRAIIACEMVARSIKAKRPVERAELDVK